MFHIILFHHSSSLNFGLRTHLKNDQWQLFDSLILYILPCSHNKIYSCYQSYKMGFQTIKPLNQIKVLFNQARCHEKQNSIIFLYHLKLTNNFLPFLLFSNFINETYKLNCFRSNSISTINYLHIIIRIKLLIGLSMLFSYAL